MPDVDGFAPGTPSWVDLASPDLDASAAFYGELLGWDCNEVADDDSAGGYRMFTLRGRTVAGMGPVQGGAPPNWTTYVSVERADATAEKVKDAGGLVFLEPMAWTIARWVGPNTEPGAVDAVALPMQSARVKDEDGNEMILFPTPWSLQYLQEKHPQIELLRLPPPKR